jgi:6-phosphogluconolactonase (cycloisomerase 2 family)
MTMRVRASLTMILAVAMMGLTSCDHYNCATGPTLGSTCTPSGSGIGSTGTGGSATAAFVFVSDGGGTGKTGTIDGFTLNTSASTFLPTPSFTAPATPLLDDGVGMVIAQKKFLYTGFGSTNQIYGWSIGTDGSLTAVTGSPYAAPFMSSVGGGIDTAAVITNPSGTLLFFADVFQDQVYVYQIASDGVLTPAGGSPFSVPFAGNMTTDGMGKYLYITDVFSNHTGTEVAAYSIASTGALTAVMGSPFVFPMWQVQGEPTGNFLVGTSGKSAAPGLSGADDLHLYVFSIQQAGPNAGAISPVAGSPFNTVYSPLSIAVQLNTNGNLVYSFGVNDSDLAFNPIEGYQLSSRGTLTAVTGSPFSNVAEGSLAQFDQSGAFLFVYGGIDTSGNIIYQLGAVDVASGALTQPTPTLTLASRGFFAVTDGQ